MSELEQTIEELEAEVLAELEEASDAQTKGAAPAEGQKKIEGGTPGGEVDDGGEAVVEPDATKSPTDVAAKKVKNALGEKNRIIYKDEIEMRKKFRRSIVAKKDLIKGETISLDKIDYKRPGYGIEPNKVNTILNKTLKLDLPKDSIILEEHIKDI